MKHFALALSFYFCVATLSAQYSPWRIGLHYTHDVIGLTKGNELVESIHKGSATITPTVSYAIGQRLRLSTGIGFGYLKYELTDYALNFGCDNNGMGGYDPFHSYWNIRDNVRLLSIPIDAMIYFPVQKNSFYVKPGFAYMKLFDVNSDVTLHECGDTGGSFTLVDDVTKPSQFQSNLKIGYEFGVNAASTSLSRLHLQIECGGSYYLTQAFKERFPNMNYWSWGGALGLRYDLKTKVNKATEL